MTALALLGAGMGITAAPATGEIMASVPLAKAGVGSAVNDTTGELGGAMDIALLGSVADGAASVIGRSLSDGTRVVAQATRTFTDAFTVANSVSVAIAVAAARLMLTWHRRG
jgi:hypothetical protein